MSRTNRNATGRLRGHVVHAACQPLERRVLLSLAPAGPEFRVNTFTTNAQAFPAVAVDGDGDFVVVWDSTLQDGSGYGVFAQRYNASGVPQSGEFRVNTFTTGNQWQPAVAMDADGDFVVVWDSFGQDGSSDGIFAQRYNAAGQPQGTEFRVNTFTSSQQAQPAVAMDGAGNFGVAWSSRDQDGNLLGVYARRYDFLGVPQGGEFRVNTVTLGDQSNPAVAMTPTGDFVIAWQSGGGPNFDIAVQRYNAGGVAQGGEFRVNTYTTATQNLPALALGPSGDFVVAWQSENQDGEIFGVYAQRFDAAGAAQGGEFRVNEFTSASQQTPALVTDAAGNFLITWASGGNQDGSSYGVYARQYNAAGAAQGAEFRVNTFTTGFQGGPAVALAPSTGDVAVAWFSNGQDGSFAGVYAQRYAESTDTAGPVVAGVFANGRRVEPYSVHQPPVQQILVSFSENVTNATNASNWLLTRNGVDVSNQISSVAYGFNSTTNRYEALVNLSTPQTGGNFNLVARDTLRDAAGNALDGNADGAPGGSFARPFSLAEPAPAGGEFQVNTYTTNTQQLPEVASDATGNFVVAWTSEGQDGSGAGVYARRYNALGVPQGAEFRVNSTTAGNQENAAIAMDSDGDFVIAWQNGGQTVQGIYAKRYSASGVPQGGEFQVSAGIESSLTFPRVAMDGDGDFVVAWTHYVSSTAADTYARRYNAAGVAQGTAFLVNTYTPERQTTYGVAMDHPGNFVIVWTSYGQEGVYSGVYGQRYNAAGVPQGGEFRANSITTAGPIVGSVGMDADGDFVITWTGSGLGDGLGVYARRFRADGVPQGPEFRVNSTTTHAQLSPRVAVDSDGEFVITWTSYDAIGFADVHGQRYNAAGTPRGGEFRVNVQTAVQSRYPSVALDEDGDFVVVWQRFVSSDEVFGRRYVLDDTPAVGTLADSPDPVQPGAPLTLSASNVTDDGTVNSVSFYRESNGVAGLQVGFQGDTHVGTANAPAAGVWSVQVPTAGLGGTYTYWAQATDDAGLIGRPASTTNTVIPGAPAVTSSSFTFATLPQRLRFTFDQNVGPSLGLDDIVVQQLPAGPTVVPNSVSFDAATNTATFTFNSALPDGRYRARLIAAGISGPGGQLPADHLFEFTFLRGDANGDGRVNLNDFNILAANFGQSPRDFTQGDFDYSGNVNLNDFNLLASRFGTVLGPGVTTGSGDDDGDDGDDEDDDGTRDALS